MRVHVPFNIQTTASMRSWDGGYTPAHHALVKSASRRKAPSGPRNGMDMEGTKVA